MAIRPLNGHRHLFRCKSSRKQWLSTQSKSEETSLNEKRRYDRGVSFLTIRGVVLVLSNMTNRIAVFRQMLDSDPDNTMVMFGLAKEYEKLGQHQDVIDLLENYLAKADDEGNAYGVLAQAYNQTGNRQKAIETYQKGIDVSMAHGHPSMANEYRMTLDLDLSE